MGTFVLCVTGMLAFRKPPGIESNRVGNPSTDTRCKYTVQFPSVVPLSPCVAPTHAIGWKRELETSRQQKTCLYSDQDYGFASLPPAPIKPFPHTPDVERDIFRKKSHHKLFLLLFLFY